MIIETEAENGKKLFALVIAKTGGISVVSILAFAVNRVLRKCEGPARSGFSNRYKN